jgi:hypothetical protein
MLVAGVALETHHLLPPELAALAVVEMGQIHFLVHLEAQTQVVALVEVEMDQEVIWVGEMAGQEL